MTSPEPKKEWEIIRNVMYGDDVDFIIHADGRVEYPKSGQLYAKISNLLASRDEALADLRARLSKYEQS